MNAMIEAAGLQLDATSPARPAPRPRGETTGFSYALAEAALEKGAGARLRTFGAAPAGDGAGRPAAPRFDAAPPQDRAAEEAAVGERSGAPRRRDPEAAPPAVGLQAPPAAPPPAVAAAPAAKGAPPATPPAPAVALASAAPPPATARATPTAEPPGAASARAPAKQAARAAPAEPPARTPAAFAEVIARRLGEGKSEFEIRLDPPQFGRVEGRLVIGDDGGATLALVFETEAALAHFARDGETLRSALAAAGFDLGQSALSFSLAERGRSGDGLSPGADAGPAAAGDGGGAPAAQLRAHDGAIDISV